MLGPKIPADKLPLPGLTVPLATNTGAGAIVMATGEVSLGAAPVGALGTLGSINAMTAES
jgi:hypothetical protein